MMALRFARGAIACEGTPTPNPSPQGGGGPACMPTGNQSRTVSRGMAAAKSPSPLWGGVRGGGKALPNFAQYLICDFPGSPRTIGSFVDAKHPARPAIGEGPAADRSPPLRRRCPAGPRGALSLQPSRLFHNPQLPDDNKILPDHRNGVKDFFPISSRPSAAAVRSAPPRRDGSPPRPLTASASGPRGPFVRSSTSIHRCRPANPLLQNAFPNLTKRLPHARATQERIPS